MLIRRYRLRKCFSSCAHQHRLRSFSRDRRSFWCHRLTNPSRLARDFSIIFLFPLFINKPFSSLLFSAKHRRSQRGKVSLASYIADKRVVFLVIASVCLSVCPRAFLWKVARTEFSHRRRLAFLLNRAGISPRYDSGITENVLYSHVCVGRWEVISWIVIIASSK